MNHCLFSPDGKLLATASDHVVRIWDAESAKEIHAFNGHRSTISRLAFCPDGSKIASAGAKGVVKTWVLDDDRETSTFFGHTNAVCCLCFNKKGTRVISGGRDNSIRIWDAATGEELLHLDEHTSPITQISLDQTDELLLTSSQDGNSFVWDVSVSKESKVLRGHKYNVENVKFSPDDEIVYSESVHGETLSWRLDSEQTIQGIDSIEFSKPKNESRNGRWLLIPFATKVFAIDKQFKDSSRERKVLHAKALPNVEWHKKNAKSFESKELWFASLFHYACICKFKPDDEEAISGFRNAYSELAAAFEESVNDLDEILPLVVESALSKLNSK